MREGAGTIVSAADRIVRVAMLAGWTVAAGAMLMPQAARAQFFWNQPELSADDAARAVMEHGFRPLRQPTRNDRVYVADVLDRRGRHERLIVSADSGEILQRFYLDDTQPFRRYADPTIPPGPIPPARIPNNPDQPNLFSRLFGGGQDEGTDRPRQLAPSRELPVPAPPRPHVRRTPRVVERAPETVRPSNAIESAPLAPVTPRPAQTSVAPANAAPATPSAPVQTTVAPAEKPPAAAEKPVAPAERPVRVIRTDPLAIPGSREQDAKSANPASSVAAKPATPPPPVKPAAAPAPVGNKDVPVAPLD